MLSISLTCKECNRAARFFEPGAGTVEAVARLIARVRAAGWQADFRSELPGYRWPTLCPSCAEAQRAPAPRVTEARRERIDVLA